MQTSDFWVAAHKYNYITAFQSCQGEGLPSTVVLEDDAVATKHVVQNIATAIATVSRASKGQWESLKFFTTEYFGDSLRWNAGTILYLGVVPALLGTTATAVTFVVERPKVGRGTFLVIALASFIALSVFAVGAACRRNIIPVFPRGASKEPGKAMAQAFFHLEHVVPDLVAYLRASDFSRATDLTVGDYFVGRESQWRQIPALFQHVGEHSSHPGRVRTTCNGLFAAWSFRPG